MRKSGKGDNMRRDEAPGERGMVGGITGDRGRR